MTDILLPDHCVDIVKYTRELGELLQAIREGRAYYDSEAGEFYDKPKEEGDQPSTLFDWIDQQLDLLVLYKRNDEQGPTHPEFVPHSCEILITCGGPTVRLCVRDGWNPELLHSWGWNRQNGEEEQTRTLNVDLGQWIIEELGEVYCG